MNFDIEPCQKKNGKIQNFLGENGYGQPYKSPSLIMSTCVTFRFCLGLHSFCPCSNLFTFSSNLPKLNMYLFVMSLQLLKFVEIMVSTCIVIRTPNFWHTTFGPLNFYLNANMKDYRCNG